MQASAVSDKDYTGQIQLVVGPMFSGKSTELLRRVRRYTHSKKSCLLIKYSKDQRYSSECVFCPCLSAVCLV
jgi:thymidine kinase